MICPTCKSNIRDGAVFCPVCGKPVQQTAASGLHNIETVEMTHRTAEGAPSAPEQEAEQPPAYGKRNAGTASEQAVSETAGSDAAECGSAENAPSPAFVKPRPETSF